MEKKKEYPETIVNCLERLEGIKKELHEIAIEFLLEGELKPHNNIALGESYPYDYDLYVRESIDPDILLINQLKHQVERTVKKIESKF
jgi:hypothetical protein